MPPVAAVPFHLRRSQDVFAGTVMSSTTETVHGLLRLEGGEVVMQWRLSRQTEHMGAASYRTEAEVEEVRELILPAAVFSGATVRRRWWDFVIGPRLVLRAADLRAFEEVAGEGGLKLAHPAEIVLRLRRADVLAAEEFAAELAMALALRAVEEARGDGGEVEPGAPDRGLPGADDAEEGTP